MFHQKMYSTPKRIHSWPHQRRITTVAASSPHQRLTSSSCARGHCLQSARFQWLVDLGEKYRYYACSYSDPIHQQLGICNWKVPRRRVANSIAYDRMGQHLNKLQFSDHELFVSFSTFLTVSKLPRSFSNLLRSLPRSFSKNYTVHCLRQAPAWIQSHPFVL